MEEWEDIEGYEGLYQVSSLGNVFSTRLGRKLKPIIKSNGYVVVSLSKRQYFVHRLVASAFIPNPERKPFIDHINTITSDNRVDNLRWVTQMENMHNPISVKRRLKVLHDAMYQKFGKDASRHREVFQYSLDGTFIKRWLCISDACRAYKIDTSSVCRCCKGQYAQAGGYIWRYEDAVVKPYKSREKKILQFDKEGNLIKEWDKVTDAASFYRTTTGRICYCLKGHSKTCKGYVWKYKNCENQIELNKEFL